MAQSNAFEVPKHPRSDSFTAPIRMDSNNFRNPLSATAPRKKGPQELTNVKMTNIFDDTKAKIKIKHAFGGTRTLHQSIQSFAAVTAGDRVSVDRLVYRIGKQICVVDPENDNQQFFSGRHRSVSNVLHFSISYNQRHICMCEVINQESLIADATAQLSVYSLSSFTRLKSLSHPSKANFISSTFCGDPKYIAALTDETERQIILWQWEKEKTCKAVSITLPILRLSSAPCINIMLLSSGPGVLKSWFLGPDGTFRSASMLPTAKENENFIDHCWLPQTFLPTSSATPTSTPTLYSSGTVYRMVALTDFDHHTNAQKTSSFNHGLQEINATDNRVGMMMNNVGNNTTTFSPSSSTSQRSFLSSRMQNVFIFEGSDVAVTNNSNLVAPAITLELKQILHVRVDLLSQGGNLIVTLYVHRKCAPVRTSIVLALIIKCNPSNLISPFACSLL